ncbi:MAG: hypothetical protein Q8Q01_03620 [archaeon]|nr:hypothetical protein [archaeon]
MPEGHPKHHNLRFFIILGTLVVAGIFLLLLVNDQGFSLTSAIVGSTDSNGEVLYDKDPLMAINSKNSQANNFDIAKEISLDLMFDGVPELKEEKVKVGTVGVDFTNLETEITINGDQLELQNIEKVSLVVSGFEGEMLTNEGVISLKGKAKKISVNGVSLASLKELEISFTNLPYDSITLTEVTLNSVEFPRGSGSLKVGDRLDYPLKDDLITMGSFDGNVLLSKEGEQKVSFIGLSNGVVVQGQDFNFGIG